MDDQQAKINILMGKFLRVVNQLNSLEQKTYDFDVGEPLYPSEIHTIQAIGCNIGCNVTALASRLGVSKAAASQMVTKLKEREFVRKTRSLDNNKEILLILTQKGKTAFNAHERLHADMYSDFIEYMNTVPQEQVEIFSEVLDKVAFYIDQYSKK